VLQAQAEQGAIGWFKEPAGATAAMKISSSIDTRNAIGTGNAREL
jgi:hypothetical protein